MSGNRIAYDTFQGKHRIGSVSVYETADGETWARITIDGIEVTNERIDNAEPSIPLIIERTPGQYGLGFRT